MGVMTINFNCVALGVLGSVTHKTPFNDVYFKIFGDVQERLLRKTQNKENGTNYVKITLIVHVVEGKENIFTNNCVTERSLSTIINMSVIYIYFVL